MLFERLRDAVPWRGERRQMYERVVDVPRLLAFYDETMPLPDPVARRAEAQRSTTTTAPELGEPFATAGLCLYRDGRDSVAWHGDRIGRSSTQDTMVAIIVLGEPRALLLRPRSGGATLRHDLGHGDLLVMGGSCSAHLGARRPEVRAAHRPAHQHPVPPVRRPLSRTSSGLAHRDLQHRRRRRRQAALHEHREDHDDHDDPVPPLRVRDPRGEHQFAEQQRHGALQPGEHDERDLVRA